MTGRITGFQYKARAPPRGARVKKCAILDNCGALRPRTVGIRLNPAAFAMNLFLYLTTVLIWGTTWIAIKWQLGVVAPPVSIAWRFWIAALLSFALLRVLRRPLWPPRAAWRFLVAQGVALFCLNFLCFYYAERVVPSGLVAVVFSIAPLLNSLNGRLFMGRPLQPSAIAGALLGLAGIVCLFVQQMAGHLGDHAELIGLAVAFLGTLCFSTGNLLSSRMQSMGLNPLVTNSWAMLIGASILTVGSACAGYRFQIEPDARYLGALAYLGVFGSVVGFTAYLTLVGRIGPERAAYCTVLFPVVALALSTVYEGYQWSPLAVLGLVLVLGGNLVAFGWASRFVARRVGLP
jgi:drug/metabolite transporter (DMT)-like permease